MRDLLTFVLVTLWCPSDKLLWHVKGVPNIMSKSKMYLLMTNMTLKNIKSKTNSLTYCDQRTAKLRLSTYHIEHNLKVMYLGRLLLAQVLDWL